MIWILIFLYCATVITPANFMIVSDDSVPSEVAFSAHQAVDILSQYVSLQEDILIRIIWTSLRDDQIALCDLPNFCQTQRDQFMMYPSALYKQMTNNSISCFMKNGVDMEISINSGYREAFYFGFEQRSIRWYELDLPHVIMHEIFHGMGVFSGFLMDDSSLTYIPNDNQLITVYDWVLFRGRGIDGIPLNTSVPFNLHSIVDRSFLTTMPLILQSTMRALVNLSLYAPATFRNGISLSHQTGPGTLLFYNTLRGQQVAGMDVHTLALLEEMGYTTKNCDLPNLRMRCGYCDQFDPCTEHNYYVELVVNMILNNLYFIQEVLRWLP